MKLKLAALTVLILALLAGWGVAYAANPPTVSSSTMVFEGTLTNNGNGTYSGVLCHVKESTGGGGDGVDGYDVYARNGAKAWFGDGTTPVWSSQDITAHDAWPTWDPDTPDWYQYSLELKLDGGQYKWAVRNHAGADAANPCSTSAAGVPMSGLMDWGNLYAEETDTGAYLSGTGTPEIPGGAAGHGGGPHAWDMDWSWGSEAVPLEYPGFDVNVQDLGGGNYRVTLTPAEGPVKNLNTGETFATIQAAIDDADTLDGHTITVAAGTFTEHITNGNVAGNTPDDYGKQVNLWGTTDTDGTPLTVIEGSYSINMTGDETDWSIENIKFVVTTKDLLTIKDAYNLTIKNCVFDGSNLFLSGKNGVAHYSGPNGNQDWKIEGCSFQNGLYVGISSRITNLTVKDCTFTNVKSGINQMGGNNLVVQDSTFSVEAQAAGSDTYGIRFASDATQNLTISGGSITVDRNGLTADPGTYHAAIIVRANASGTLQANGISIDGEVVNLSITNLDAKLNWWGSASGPAVGTITGPVTYCPWLDDEGGTVGVYPVTNVNTSVGFCSIQAAHDAATAGDVIEVKDGTYNVSTEPAASVGLVNIYKQITIKAADDGNAIRPLIDASGRDGVFKIHVHAISGGQIVIEGFDIYGDTTTDIAITALVCDIGEPTKIVIGDNYIHGMNSGFDTWGYGGCASSAEKRVSGIEITGNTFSDLGVAGSVQGFGIMLEDLTDWANAGNQFAAIVEGNVFEDIYDGTSGNYGAGAVIPRADADNGEAANARIAGNIFERVSVDVGITAGDVNATEITGNSFGDSKVLGVFAQGISNGPVNASGNWWGSADPATVKAAANAGTLVDYTPWLAAGTDTDLVTAGFQGDFSTLWVDDDSPQTGSVGRIQEGINLVSGSTVYVADGTYEEQVVIAKDLTLQGQSLGAIIKAPVSMPACFTTSADNKPIVCIKDDATATVDTLTIDGAGRGSSHYKFEGVAFRNAGGTLKNCAVKDIRDEPFSGAQHGVAVYAYNDDATARTINVWDNEITGFQKNAMALNAGDTTPLAVDVRRNEVTGAGTTIVTAQNGIQVWAVMGSGTIDGNTISGIAYDGPDWVATTILNCDRANLDITNNTVTNCHLGIYNIDGSGQLNGNNLTIIRAGGYGAGIVATDPPLAAPSPFGAEDAGKSALRSTLQAASTLNIEASNNTVTFSGTDNTSTFGIEADAGYGADDIAFTANGNTVTGFEVGIELWQCQSGCSTGVFASITAHNNCLSLNTYGMRSNASYLTADGTLNWWGNASGPYHATKNPGGLGDDVSDYIDFEPWITGGCGTTTTGGNWRNTTTGVYDDLQDSLDNALAGETVQAVCSGDDPVPGGATATVAGVKIDLHGCTVSGAGGSFLTVDADNIHVFGPGTIDGGGGGGAGIVVQAGAGNFWLAGATVTGWLTGIEVAGDVASLKIVDNWIHSNAGDGLLIDTGITLGGVVTIEGNLFKVNTGNGIQHNGTGTLPAERNSWGDPDGPATAIGGDGIGGSVDAGPWTYVESFFDVTMEVERHVPEGSSFDVVLQADAVNLYGLDLRFSYDPDRLTLNSTTDAAGWKCVAEPGLPPGTVGYGCYRYPTNEWTATAGAIATFNFTAKPLPGDTALTTYLDINDLETEGSDKNGWKVFVNNAGFNDPSADVRDITDTDDGRLVIDPGGNYTGYVDLQGRADDSGAVVEVHDLATYGSTLLAAATSIDSGAYTTAFEEGYGLFIGSKYWLVVDRDLYLPTTPIAATDYYNSAKLTDPLTLLNTAVLLAGDATNDDTIDIFDLSCIGNNYCKLSGWTECGEVGSGGTPDVNEDGKVSIHDLSLSGGNFEKDYSLWTPK